MSSLVSKSKPPCNGNLQKFLVECNGELLSVFVAPFGKWIRVFKLNKSKMTWVRVENLSNYMLYVIHRPYLQQKKNLEWRTKLTFLDFMGKALFSIH